MSPRKDSLGGVGRWGRAAVSALLLWLAVAQPAWAITLRDIIELSKAGVSDAVIVELIESDGSVFRLTSQDVLNLSAQGVSDRVVLALLRTWQAERARIRAAEEASEVALAGSREWDANAAAPPAETIVVQPPVQLVSVPVPILVPVPSRTPGRARLDQGRLDRRTSDRVDGLPNAPTGTAGRARESGHRENKPFWIVNSGGWIVR